MIKRRDIKHFFDLIEIEKREDELRRRELAREVHDVDQRKKMVEYLVEHLDPKALIAVHQTDYFPYEGVLRPRGHYLFPFFRNNNAKKIIEDLQVKQPRITIHFTLNYPVSGVVAGGEWIEWNSKYAIIIPVEDFINRVICLNPVDTWIIGSLKLPTSAEILVPENEYYGELSVYETLTFKPKLIPYPNGTDLKQAIKIRIQKREYRLMDGGDYDWYQERSLQSISHFINESIYLTEKEKQRLLQILATKGYSVWSYVFGEMSKKLNKINLSHKKTEWRRIEVWFEELCGFLFNPSEYELGQPLSEFGFKFESIPEGLKTYKEKVLKEIGNFIFPEEKEYIDELANMFDRLEKWTRQLYAKYRIEKSKELTLGQFLSNERVI